MPLAILQPSTPTPTTLALLQIHANLHCESAIEAARLSLFLFQQPLTAAVACAGRAVVDVVIERPNTGTAFLTKQGGGLQPQAKLQLVIDGYSAPITAGNFIQNVQKGMYDNTPISSSYVSVNVGPPQPKSGVYSHPTAGPFEIILTGSAQVRLVILHLNITGVVEYSSSKESPCFVVMSARIVWIKREASLVLSMLPIVNATEQIAVTWIGSLSGLHR